MKARGVNRRFIDGRIEDDRSWLVITGDGFGRVIISEGLSHDEAKRLYSAIQESNYYSSATLALGCEGNRLNHKEVRHIAEADKAEVGR
ncbi:MAG: hypothetical protein DMF68_01485 [Acidobacteria bacterium]|nr:MAG: hypothetical protein DMF68_01485 [Acidobacteriota bacterium]